MFLINLMCENFSKTFLKEFSCTFRLLHCYTLLIIKKSKTNQNKNPPFDNPKFNFVKLNLLNLLDI